MRLRVRPVAAQWATRGIDWIPSVDHEITEKTYINDENLPGSISDGDWVEAARQRGSEAARRRGGEAARRRRGEAVRRRSHIFGKHLLKLQRGSNPFDFKFVEHHKTPAFTFDSSHNESVWNVDGEILQACQVSVRFQEYPFEVDDDIKKLAHGSNRWVSSHKGYIVNGFKFEAMEHRRYKATSNYGVYVLESTINEYEVDYYGALEEILELKYYGLKDVIVLFKVEARGKLGIPFLEEQYENVSPIVEVAYQEEEISRLHPVLTYIDIDDVNIICDVDEEELNSMEIEELRRTNDKQVIVDAEESEEEFEDFESNEELNRS
ncbi:hypothetical protein ZIOFF_024654 [Zingiber officinale]|uniref:Uncharacterized protein n=1 Tax=Zingiber officinale TaxID=94328 RepID=A0A8J5H2N3_ZINOF|nr:hypothetical protein ZIOFF_024654 [Zingiber officinale]